MRAVVLDTPGPIDGSPLRIAEVPTPEPAAGQLLVKVEACGVCRSNLHMIEGDWASFGVPAMLPIIPGHEVVGRVAAIGDGVDRFSTGQRVGVQPLWSTCETCEYCRGGREQLCFGKQTTGESVDGGYAEYLLTTAAHTYAVPDELDSAAAAPLFCPGVTAYGAVAQAQLQPGQSVAVFGVGGVGHMAVQFAQLAGAEVIGVARSRPHLELLRSLGVERTVDLNTADAGEVLARGGGVDAAILFAPSAALARQALLATKRGGTLVLGVNADVGELSFFENRRVISSVIGSREQMREVLRIAAAGKVRVHCETFPLAEATDVLRRLKRGEVQARAVLVVG